MLRIKLIMRGMICFSKKNYKMYQVLESASSGLLNFSSDPSLLATDENYFHKVILDAFFESLWGFILMPTVVEVPDSMSSYLSNLWKVSKERQDCLNDRMRRHGTLGRELFSIENKLDYYAKVIERGGEETAYLRKLYAYHTKTCKDLWKMLQLIEGVRTCELYSRFSGFDNLDLEIVDMRISEIVQCELPRGYCGWSWSSMIANASYYGAKKNVML